MLLLAGGSKYAIPPWDKIANVPPPKVSKDGSYPFSRASEIAISPALLASEFSKTAVKPVPEVFVSNIVLGTAVEKSKLTGKVTTTSSHGRILKGLHTSVRSMVISALVASIPSLTSTVSVYCGVTA